jgi:dTDP-glucose 4,6-dehydratase
MPLDSGYAAASFFNDILKGKPIRLESQGQSQRSYLYSADLAIWLWTILFRGRTGEAYNVGSEEAIRILDLAGKIAALGRAPLPVETAAQVPGRSVDPDFYLPSTKKAREELGLKEWTNLDEGLNRTFLWYTR